MMERKLRRNKQELPKEVTLQILRQGKVAVWAVDGDNDYPYAVPVNYVYDNGFVYIHCAKQGHKIDAIKRNPKCSLCIIDKDDIVPEEYTCYFRSIIAFGEAVIIDTDKDKVSALKLLCNKYSKGTDPTEEINRFLKTVCIVKIRIHAITGKEAIELARKR
ncbi:MAG: pyridoxamine 5'-phosphate oxidase family protein [Prevotella sp.]|nr:pyridoxamine 5'-phosphate oxidase family protein [Prevotella sp.]